jgi:hypothetical protein
MAVAVDLIFTLVANLLPLAGVAWWGWDAFEVLILYWMQTVLIVVFALLNIGKLPPTGLGEIKVDGRTRPATRRDYLMMFSVIGVVFCAAHLLFLWVFFAGAWSKVVSGPVTFWQAFVIRNGAWMALGLNLLAGLARYLLTPPHGALVRWIGTRIGLKQKPKPGARIDTIFGALFIRIFVMQAAIIFGAMLLMSYGARTAPLMILIGLKTLFDLGGGAMRLRPQVVTSLRR